MQRSNLSVYVLLFGCMAIIAVCFTPWVHYNSIDETFTGFHVKRFATGVYYGRPGMFISVFAVIIILLTIWKNNIAKRAALFTAAVLFAYCIRTYILFTGAMFKGEVNKLAGIYLVVLLSILILISAAFPKKV